MVTSSDMSLTAFSQGWHEFEERLARFLGHLALPTISDTIVVHAPGFEGQPRQIAIEGRLIGCPGVDVRVSGHPSRFYPITYQDTYSFPDAAREICTQFRDVWQVAEPSMLTVDGGLAAPVNFDQLGLPRPADVPNETSARVARRPVIRLDEPQWPETVEEMRGLIEAALSQRFGAFEKDDDGDYVVIVDGTRLYVSVMDDQPLIRLWRAAVGRVRSRRAALIEAHYLNRIYPLTKWVLWGHVLIQEIHVPAAPFFSTLLLEQLDQFVEHYDANLSPLRLRLGDDD